MSVITAFPIFSSVNTDRDLIALGDQYDALAKDLALVFENYDAADAIYQQIKPIIPESIRPHSKDWFHGLPMARYRYTANDVELVKNFSNERTKEIVRDFRAWNQADNEATARAGLTKFDKEIERLYEAMRPIEEKIIKAEATTLEGFKVKARVIHRCCGGELGDHDAESNIMDRMMFSLSRDLARANGLPINPSPVHEKEKDNAA